MQFTSEDNDSALSSCIIYEVKFILSAVRFGSYYFYQGEMSSLTYVSLVCIRTVSSSVKG